MIHRLHRNLSYLILFVLFASGVLHFVLHDYFPHQGPFGPSPGPWEPWVLRLHGAAAMLSLVVIGSVLPGHVARFWRMARNRLPGATVLGVMVALIVSGYGLYYFGGDQVRALTRQAHIVLGLLALPAFAAHVWFGIRARHRQRGAGIRLATATPQKPQFAYRTLKAVPHTETTSGWPHAAGSAPMRENDDYFVVDHNRRQ